MESNNTERLEAENAELKKGVKAPPAEAKQEPKPSAERPKRLRYDYVFE